MENKNPEMRFVPIHWFKTIDENGKLTTKGFVAFEDFRKVVDESKPIGIKNVIFNPPATIVLWNDGTKTVVKAENEVFDKEKGLAMAICKRTNGNNGRYFEVFKKYCNEKPTANNTLNKFEIDVSLDNVYRSIATNAKKAIKALMDTLDTESPSKFEEQEKTTEKD